MENLKDAGSAVGTHRPWNKGKLIGMGTADKEGGRPRAPTPELGRRGRRPSKARLCVWVELSSFKESVV